MKNIRHGVFETNSSSTHSISIASSGGLLDSITPDEDGVITLYGGEYGWSWEKFTDAKEKANYLATTRDNQEMLCKVVKEHTGAKEVVIRLMEGSYIDHQSYGAAEKAFESEDAMRNFIFNPKSILYTGNDNEDEPPNFYDNDTSSFTHVLTLEGSPGSVLIHENPDDKLLDHNISQLFANNVHNRWRTVGTGFFDCRMTANREGYTLKSTFAGLCRDAQLRTVQLEEWTMSSDKEPRTKTISYDIKPRTDK